MEAMAAKEALIARANQPGEDALRLHPFYKGKIQVLPKCAVRGFEDFAVWYTPGVAAPCRAIQTDPALVYEHTNKSNSIAIVTDGTRVLGLGDIGPEAALPVMEGKALLFKYLGGVDAIPICLASKNFEEIIRTVQLLQPAFGGINLEDIAQPKCFHIVEALRQTMQIPVWHDDQQGTATVVLAGLLNALELVGKRLDHVKIALVGMGAANVATYRLLKVSGIDPHGVIACDRGGTLHRRRADVDELQLEYADKWRVCLETNADCVAGGIKDAIRGSDVCIAFSASGPDIIKSEWVRTMARDPIVFACANPVPGIWPWDAREAGAVIIATGRSDFPNQLNNSLVFPGIFRGALDIRARTISDGMARAAAYELAACAQETGLREDRILPRMDEWEVVPREAVAVALAAQQEGLAQLSKTREQLHNDAVNTIGKTREATRLLLDEGLIPTHG